MQQAFWRARRKKKGYRIEREKFYMGSIMTDLKSKGWQNFGLDSEWISQKGGRKSHICRTGSEYKNKYSETMKSKTDRSQEDTVFRW